MAVHSSASTIVRAPTRTHEAAIARRPWYLLVIGLLAIDTGAIGTAFALSYLIRFKAGLPFLGMPPHQLSYYILLSFVAIPGWLGVFAIFHLYDREYLFSGFGEYARVANAAICAIMATIAVGFLQDDLIISRGWLILVLVLSIVAVGSGRFGARRLLGALRRRGYFVSSAIIVGANEEGQALADQFARDPACGLRVVGFADSRQPVGTGIHEQLQVLGPVSALADLIRAREVEEIVVAMTAVSRDEFLDLYRSLGHDHGPEIRLTSGLYEILTTGVRVQEVAYVPLVTPQRTRITGVDALMKATLDYVGATLGLIVFAPLLLVLALLVKLDSPGPVFHRRIVLGRTGGTFGAFKFRTMVVNADDVLKRDPELRQAFEQGYKLKDDPRVTRVGRFLRKTSLDELPQLFNVLRGDMSLVGPRMISPDESARYGKWQLNLLTVKPGITGPWQVQGRGDIPYEERVRLSTQYIRNYTIWADLEILLRTIPAVLKSRGAY